MQITNSKLICSLPHKSSRKEMSLTLLCLNKTNIKDWLSNYPNKKVN